MKNMEQKYRAKVEAKVIAENPGHFGADVQKHARQMVDDGRGEFKFAMQYDRKAGSYAGATLWVLSDTTVTMRDANVTV